MHVDGTLLDLGLGGKVGLEKERAIECDALLFDVLCMVLDCNSFFHQAIVGTNSLNLI